jgi:hypothetical protein
MLAAIRGDDGIEGILVCLIVSAIVAAAVYIVCGPILRQAWAGLAAGVVFLLGALLCLL